MSSEVQLATERMMSAWEQFKTTNDENQRTQLRERDRRIDALESKIASGLGAGSEHARLDQLEAQLGRMRLMDTTAVRRSDDDAFFSGSKRREFSRAIRSYLSNGDSTELKGLFAGSDPTGGYTVDAQFSNEMTRKLFQTSPLRKWARIVEIDKADAFEELIDNDEADASWVTETGARTETTSPELGKLRIPTHEMYASPKITQTLIDDSNIDIGAWLSGKLIDKFARKENTAFISGSGVGQPRGLTSYPTAAISDASRPWGTLEHVATGTSGGFGTAPNGSNKLIDLVHRLKAEYKTPGSNTGFLCNSTTLSALRQLQSNNQYIWLPSMMQGEPETLLGYPVLICEDLPSYTTADSLAVWYGAFKRFYTVVDRTGFRMLRDPFSAKPHTIFYAYRRVGGDVTHFECAKALKFGTS